MRERDSAPQCSKDLIERGCITLVTTHHNALKLFGSQTNGAVNAAMEFDPQTLKPTYRLIPGRPGRSYGLDMATRLGVPDAVIRQRRDRRISETIRGSKTLLKQVENDSRLLTTEREALNRNCNGRQSGTKQSESLLRQRKKKPVRYRHRQKRRPGTYCRAPAEASGAFPH